MAIEIERKFLVTGDGWRQSARSASLLRQGYLSPVGLEATVRVRCLSDKACLAIKGPRVGLARAEFEYEIPLADGEEILRTLCENRELKKVRYIVEAEGLIWNIDEFRGAHSGLVLAEVELTRADQPLNLPAWVGEEITDRHEYRNAVLAEGGIASRAAFRA
ncbi:CYTH domain-containing protein [Bosea sp. TAF32]|uniref:CYTH domain-containing protein n=1 Tax=Bosea sp. TAF32 TaxID=3237482 RepID=UPI003F902585